MNARQPKVVVAGAGAWGRNHVRTFHGLGALAGVVEPSPALQAQVQADFPGIPVWSRLEEALPAADGVVLATPAPTHAALARTALAAGKGVLVEKPMTLDTEDAEALAAAAARSDRPVLVGHLLLFQPAIEELKRQVEAGLIGRVLRVHQERLNHGRVRSTENVMWSFSCHDIAVLLHLLGEAPTGVQATGAAFLQAGIHDDVHLELAFASGRSAHIHAAWYWPGKQRGLRVFGETGMLVYDEADQSLTLHRKHLKGGAGPDALAPLDGGQERIFQGDGEPLKLEAQHFLACLAGTARPRSGAQDGLEVVRVLERAQAQLSAPAVAGV